jgi:hypothetical protein
MHVDLSFSYLRSAEAASFDKKSSTGTAQATIILLSYFGWAGQSLLHNEK